MLATERLARELVDAAMRAGGAMPTEFDQAAIEATVARLAGGFQNVWAEELARLNKAAARASALTRKDRP